ncbi:hypothetical protein FRC11_002287, partial [Ceratobasidium sp. 423]
MSASRSDKYYFPRGDLVLQVENTLFKIHRDILERHSGFFQGMFSVPTNDDTEGTEGKPLVLSSDLCSARSFTILCKLLYPPKIGFRLTISVRQLDEWEPVLQATVPLQMDDTRKFILAELDKDTPNIKNNTARLLRLALEYEEAPSSLRVACLRILACRRKQITPDEVHTLGGEGTCLVNRVREAVRESLNAFAIKLFSQKRSGMRSEHAGCVSGAFSRMLQTPSNLRLQRADDTYDIFQDAPGYVCDVCSQSWEEIVESLKTLSARVVDNSVIRVPSASQAQ